MTQISTLTTAVKGIFWVAVHITAPTAHPIAPAIENNPIILLTSKVKMTIFIIFNIKSSVNAKPPYSTPKCNTIRTKQHYIL